VSPDRAGHRPTLDTAINRTQTAPPPAVPPVFNPVIAVRSNGGARLGRLMSGQQGNHPAVGPIFLPQ
jgi:hypothetical protein